MTNQANKNDEYSQETLRNQHFHHHHFEIDRRGEESKKGAVLELNINLNEFTSFNDAVTDDLDGLLQEVADRIHHRLRESDVVLPMGSDKFVILLEDIQSLENADSVAHELVDILRNPFHLAKSQHVEIGTSIGISFFSEQELELVYFPRRKKRKIFDIRQHLHKPTETD